MSHDSQRSPEPCDSIPLCDGPAPGAEIVTEAQRQASGKPVSKVRPRRRVPRRAAENVEVCLSVHDASGRTEHCDCELLNISAEGAGVIFDRALSPGTRCYLSYRTISHQPIHIGGAVRNSERIERRRYRVGIKFDRCLVKEEQRPARRRSGRSVSPIYQGRRLRPIHDDAPPEVACERYSRPTVIERASGGGSTYKLTDD